MSAARLEPAAGRRSAPCSRGDERPKDVLEDSKALPVPASSPRPRLSRSVSSRESVAGPLPSPCADCRRDRCIRAFATGLRDRPSCPSAILLGDLAEVLVEDHNIVPFGPLLALAGGLVAPGVGGRTESSQWGRPLRFGALRDRAEIADENDLVDAPAIFFLQCKRQIGVEGSFLSCMDVPLWRGS